MTIKLENDPALESQVTVAAAERGISVDEYVREALLEKAQSRIRVASRQRQLTTREFLDAMAYHGPVDPLMKTQEITREFIYGDHP